MSTKESVNVYWSSFFVEPGQHWNMLYQTPTTLFEELKQNRNAEVSASASFLMCPAVSEKFKKTYVFRNTLTSKFIFKEDNIFSVLPESQPFIGIRSIRKPTIKNTNIFQYNMYWIFFSEEPLIADFTSPYFHKPMYTQYGTLISGKFDIGSWFRPVNAEIMTWESEGKLEFQEGEPLMYAHFNTEKKVNLVQFRVNQQLINYSQECVASPKQYGSFLSLKNRYTRFKQTNMQSLVLKEIKKTLGE